MKTNKWMILLLLVLCQCANELKPGKEGLDDEYEPIQYDARTTLSRGECFPIVSDRYVFLVVPGTDEWNQSIKDWEDAHTVSQLPDEVLKSISTPGLIDALINAPAFLGFSFYAIDLAQYEWHKHYKWFNSAGELFQRIDVGEALLAYYKLVNFDCILYGKWGEYARLVGLEGLFTKQEVWDSMNHDKKKEAVEFLLKIYNFKDYHSRFRISLMVFIMLADQYEPIVQYAQTHVDEFDIDYINQGFFKPLLDYPSDTKIWDIMVSFAKNFINDKN